jgi:type I restriction-modification system DNA methylase subunit
MGTERVTEELTLNEMGISLGKNDNCFVYEQGDVGSITKISELLREAGGKPKELSLNEYPEKTKGKAQPEFIITFDDDIKTIIVVECKRTINKHESDQLNKPSTYAVDGVLFYTKYLKKEYNVLALAISGTKIDNIKVSTFYWQKGQDEYTEINRFKNLILSPDNYQRYLRGEQIVKKYSISEIRTLAINMHTYLREIKMTERHKPLFIAGILIALANDDFSKSYVNFTSFSMVVNNIKMAIDDVLKNADIEFNRIAYIKSAFNTLLDNSKFSGIPLSETKSIIWYVEQLDNKVKPMMDYADNSIDSLGVFYHEFIKYSGGDGRGLGIVLTPYHLTEFMCKVADVRKNSKVVDICCGSGSFLITAMSLMFEDASPKEKEKIRKSGLYGVEFDEELYTLSITNMIIRKDGKSNIHYGDCFNKKIIDELKLQNINIGLINPPYSQDDNVELDFLLNLLDILTVGGTGVCVVPMACAIGTKFTAEREKLFEKHSLKAVFSMPSDIFYSTKGVSPDVCVMVWEAHKPHDIKRDTFFGYYKNDGFVKRKKLGRIDAYDNWSDILSEWLSLYRNLEVKEGMTAKKSVTHKDEWLVEAYMETDYTKLTQEDFQHTINNYLAYLVTSGEKNEIE